MTVAESKSDRPTVERRVKSWLEVEIDDDYHDEEVPEGAVELARELAPLVRLRPTLWNLDRRGTGKFTMPIGFLADSLVFGESEDFEGFSDSFGFSIVRTPAEASALGQILDDARDDEDEWDQREWIDSAVSAGFTVIAVTAPREETPSGFVAYDRNVKVHGWDDGTCHLVYQIAPEFLYVVPSRRGMRLSSALRRAIMEDVIDDAQRLAKLLKSRRILKLSEKLRLRFRVSGEAHSSEGLMFMDGLRAAMEYTFDAYLSELPMPYPQFEGVEPDYSL